MGCQVQECIKLELEGSPERGGDSLSLQLCAQSAGDKLPFCPKASTKACFKSPFGTPDETFSPRSPYTGPR
jgi:hypothetical protein